MIYVTQDQAQEVEYLISQSIQGNHVLFDADTVRRVMLDPGQASPEDTYSVEHHIERLIGLPSLQHKRAYFEGLEPDTRDRVVRAYFNIVENNLYESDGVRH